MVAAPSCIPQGRHGLPANVQVWVIQRADHHREGLTKGKSLGHMYIYIYTFIYVFIYLFS